MTQRLHGGNVKINDLKRAVKPLAKQAMAAWVQRGRQTNRLTESDWGLERDAAGHLQLQGRQVAELVERHGSPLHVVDADQVRSNVRRFLQPGPDGQPLGQITKQVRLGKARFTLLDPRGAQLGEVRAHNWRAKDFSVFDGAGQAIARVTKRWAGLRELFTDADTYVVEVSPSAVDPLRSLAVATCLVIDVVMKQKDYND